MRFGIREFGRISQASFPIRKRGFVVTGVFLPGSSRSHGKQLRNVDEPIPPSLSRMRQDLWQSAAQYLRRLFLSARSYLRLRLDPAAGFARAVRLPYARSVALSRTAAIAARLSPVTPHRIYAPSKSAATWPAP